MRGSQQRTEGVLAENYQRGESFQTDGSPLVTMRLANSFDHLLPAELLEIVSGLSRAVALLRLAAALPATDPPLPNT